MTTPSSLRLLRALSACVAVPFLLGVALLAQSTQEAPSFLVGADISALTTHEKGGARFLDQHSQPADALGVLREAGVNGFRLRLFVDPNGRSVETNTLAYTLSLAARIRASHAQLLLDLHYSDTWADPHRQDRPKAWEKLDDEALVARVRSYTREVITAFREKGLLPDSVQLGNEITNGMLWPTGRVEFAQADDSAAWDRLARFLKAAHEGLVEGCAGLPVPKTVLHIESTGNLPRTHWWLSNALARGVPFDCIGLSYYPDWHGELKDLRDTLDLVARETGRPVMVVETAYPWKPDEHWRGRPHMPYPLSPAGQAAFLSDLRRIIARPPAATGVFYWYPEAVPAHGIGLWVDGSCALFETEGRPLPGLRALAAPPR